MNLLEAMEADLDALFFDVEEFAKTVTYVSSNGVQKDIVVAFFDDEDEGIEGAYVSVWAKTRDLPDMSKEDTFIIDGSNCDVVDFRKDGQGLITKMFLNTKRGS